MVSHVHQYSTSSTSSLTNKVTWLPLSSAAKSLCHLNATIWLWLFVPRLIPSQLHRYKGDRKTIVIPAWQEANTRPNNAPLTFDLWPGQPQSNWFILVYMWTPGFTEILHCRACEVTVCLTFVLCAKMISSVHPSLVRWRSEGKDWQTTYNHIKTTSHKNTGIN